MHFNTHLLFLPALFVISGVLSQQSASPTSGTPAVTYPASDAFIFCSGQDCTGTCEIVTTFERNDGEFASPFLSVYWYDPGHYAWVLYTCIGNDGICDQAVNIGPNTCYNMYNNGVPADFDEYYYLVDSVP